MEKIFSDEEVFDQIKDGSRKAWHDFKALTPQTISMRATLVKKPGRLEKKIATSSLWTACSYINCILKRKYGSKLQSLPRVTMFIKSFDEDTERKAANFEEKALQSFLIKKDTTYWEVRQAITVMSLPTSGVCGQLSAWT
jgi:hypothetical protein